MIARTSIAFVVVAAGISLGFKGEDSRLLWSFEPSAELSGVYASHAAVTQIGKSGPANGYALRLDFEAVERPQIEFSLTAAKSDWRPFGALALDVSNPSEESGWIFDGGRGRYRRHHRRSDELGFGSPPVGKLRVGDQLAMAG